VASKFEIAGLDDLKRALQKAGDLADKALMAAMFEEQSAVITAAQEIVPVDLGTLRGSGTVLPPEQHGQRIEVTAGFGGAAAKYAVIVHEKMGLHHPVGGPKFLERAFLQRAPKMASNLARRVESAWQQLRV
jgi:hypothetical protein